MGLDEVTLLCDLEYSADLAVLLLEEVLLRYLLPLGIVVRRDVDLESNC